MAEAPIASEGPVSNEIVEDASPPENGEAKSKRQVKTANQNGMSSSIISAVPPPPGPERDCARSIAEERTKPEPCG